MDLFRWVGAAFKAPAVLVIAPIAYVLGIVTMMPLGYDLLPNAATAIAAGVTSIVTIGGAILLWHYQQHKESTAAAHFVANLFDAAVGGLNNVQSLLDDTDTYEGWELLDEFLHKQNSTFGRMSAILDRYETIIMKLPPDAVTLLNLTHPQIIRELNDRLFNARQQFATIRNSHIVRPIEDRTALVGAIWIYGQFAKNLKDSLGIEKGRSVLAGSAKAS